MLGVIAKAEQEGLVREFFELFKIPWEFYQAGSSYDVVLCNGDLKIDNISAKLLLLYAGEKTALDTELKSQIQSSRLGADLSVFGSRLPIYGNCLTFGQQGAAVLEATSGEAAAFMDQQRAGMLVRVGFDLFAEVETLLTGGQPASNARIPTLELHISLLRDLITGCGIPLLEIPPVPAGYPFIACLTHDLDHASLRQHKFDATTFGFLYRATLGSANKFVRGRLSLKKLLTNWAAAAKLPLMHLGLAADPWYGFDHRYLEIENGRPSTFFVIPFAGYAGRRAQGPAPSYRATGYDISHIAAKIPRLTAAGCEIGLHGIDAWLDASRALEEARRISEVSGNRDLGVRMHWLYTDEKSAGVLEEAGFSYDSSAGYNDAVGYRAGTSQAFKPLHASRLLELPMHIMDTALFYADYLNLSETEAWQWITPLLDNVVQHGGTLTLNWHDRSVAPERLWGDFYIRLVVELTARGAWFSTGGQAAAWFRKRRSVVFEKVIWEEGRLHARVVADDCDDVPGLRLRYHPAGATIGAGTAYSDTDFNGTIDFSVGSAQIPTLSRCIE